MKTFFDFFTGTTGVIFAIALCGIAICLICIVSSIVIPIVIPLGTPTP